jgi:hypothetical protein
MVATASVTLIVITCLEVSCGNGSCERADREQITGLPDEVTCEHIAESYRKHFRVKTDSATCVPTISENRT